MWPQPTLRAVIATARQHGLATHLDGSRLLNAAVASGHPASAHAEGFDSVTLCLSKGLGCPVGALLAGSTAFIREARRLKHVFGGAMRQAGIVAGAGLYALRHNVDRLAEDHANAKLFATVLSQIPGVAVDPATIETNIVFFDVGKAGFTGPEMVAALRDKGVRTGAWPHQTKVRAVTHLDVGRDDIIRAAQSVRDVMGKRPLRPPCRLLKGLIMRAKYIDCGAGQIKLWQAALPDYKLDVDVNTAPFAVEDLPAILDGYDICIDDHTRIPPEVLRECSSLRHFVYFGTGAASILDLPLAEQMGIQVHTIRNYGDTTVAELAAGLVLAAARQIAAQHAVLRQGGWTKMQGMELRGRQIGLVGFGGIGREMARICAGIGLRVAVWNRSGVNDPRVRGMALDELLATSDIVSLHLGLNEDTKGFLSAARIAAMMPGAILVNTARGGLVDEAALVHALDSGHIGHAALDVFATEPLPEDSPLRSAPNVTLTAHCGFWTESATVNQVRLVQGIAGAAAGARQTV